jgi:hypothetical protein
MGQCRLFEFAQDSWKLTLGFRPMVSRLLRFLRGRFSLRRFDAFLPSNYLRGVKPCVPRIALTIAALLIVSSSFRAQEPAIETEKEAIKRAVETFLYAEDPAQVARVLDPQAKIFSVKSGDNKVTITPIGAPAKKLPKGARTRVPRQRIANIEVFENAAVVTVQTDRLSVEGPGASQKHTQYISLMRFNGEWKIVSILMPSLSLETEPRK